MPLDAAACLPFLIGYMWGSDKQPEFIGFR
jgi:hypothetical protein